MSEENTASDAPVVTAPQTNPYLIPAAIILAGLAIAAALVYTQQNTGSTASGDSLNPKVLPVDKEDHVLGAKNPDVYLIEYSDYQCPFCTRFHATVKQIIEEYDGKVAWVYRHFPLNSIHPEAQPAAIASECVAEQGGNDAFWKFTDSVFASNTGLSSGFYQATARDLGLDMDAFDACVASDKFDARIKRDLANVLDLGGEGTPYTVLLTKDGQSLSFSGALPIDRVRLLVDKAVNSVK